MSKRKLLINSLSGTIHYAINIIAAFIMSPILLKTLGNIDFGVWEMVMGVVGYLGILDLGVGGGLLRQVALAKSRDDIQDLYESISTAMVFFLVIGFLVILIFLILSSHPQVLLGPGQIGSAKISLIFLLFAANGGIVFPLNVFTGVLMGLQQHHIVNLCRALLTIFKSIAAYFLLMNFSESGLLSLAFLEFISNFIQFSIYAIKLWTDNILTKCSIMKYRSEKMKELFKFGSKSAMILIASRIQFASMPFVIGKALGVNMIVYYALPNRLVDYAKNFSITIGFPLTPFFTDLLGKNDQQALRSGWLTTAFALQCITLAMPIFLLFCGEKFLQLWIGLEFSIIGKYVLYALIGGFFAEALAPNSGQVLLAANRHGRVAMFTFAMSLCSVPLALLGARFFGVFGATLGCSITTVVISFFTLHSACRIMDVTLFGYLKKTVIPFALPLAMLAGGLWAGGIVLHVDTYWKLILQTAIGAGVYLSAVWIISIPDRIRLEILEKIRNMMLFLV